MKKIILTLLLFNVIHNEIKAQQKLQQLTTSHISIFKNGTFFITKEGEIRPENGMFALEPPTTALNGTFWLAAGKENKITSISVKPDTVKVTRQIENIAEFITSNIGKNITIILPPLGTGNTTREIKGNVINYFAKNQTAKIKTADGRMLMCNVSGAIEVYNDGTAADTYQQDSLVRMAKVQLQNNTGKINVSTVALQTGMTWVPSYFLKLIDDKTARLELKATIGNNSAESIKNAGVDLVIGNPQMFYGSQLDDISTDYFQTQVVNYNRYAQNSFRLSNMYANNVMTGEAALKQQNENDSYTPPEMATYNTDGEKTNDLYYFNLGNLNIESQSKTIVPLLTTELAYKDLYELEIADYNAYWSNRRINNDPNRDLPVWHVLKIENTGKAPFTTGPVFVIDAKDKPLAQDEMKYTAKGASVKVHLSKAIDIQSKNTEELVSSGSSTRVIDNHTYTIAVLKGKIEVNNYQAKPVKINIGKTLTGKVLNPDGGIVEAVPQNNYYRNLSSNIKWEKEIPANGKIELTYQYEVWIW